MVSELRARNELEMRPRTDESSIDFEVKQVRLGHYGVARRTRNLRKDAVPDVGLVAFIGSSTGSVGQENTKVVRRKTPNSSGVEQSSGLSLPASHK